MSRNYNFCAGPAALPNEVLDQLKAEIPDWQGKGLSVMEMSHRSKEFVEIAETAKQDFIDLLGKFFSSYHYSIKIIQCFFALFNICKTTINFYK